MDLSSEDRKALDQVRQAIKNQVSHGEQNAMRKLMLVATSVVGIGAMGAAATQTPAQAVTPNPELIAYASTDHSVALADGRKLRLVCMGKGAPTVILTAGAGNWSVVWNQVQPSVAKKTRACAWDRPGQGLSEGSPSIQTVVNRTSDLEAALDRGHIEGPYIMVGHSLGAYESLLVADRRPNAVVGMVLVDPSFPGQGEDFKRVAPLLTAYFRKYNDKAVDHFRQCAADLRSKTLTATSLDPNQCLKYPPSYPVPLSAALARLDMDPLRFETVSTFWKGFDGDMAMVVNAERNYGAMPLVVLTATLPDDFDPDTPKEVRAELPQWEKEWQRQHDNLAALSTRGVNRRVAGAGHYIQRDKPEVVIDAINEVVDQARLDAIVTDGD